MDLVSTREIADLFGISRQRADKLTRKDDFPPPEADLAIGRVWSRPAVVAWGEATGRLSKASEPESP